MTILNLRVIDAIQQVTTSEVKAADFNPTNRTARSALRGLLESIEKSGIINPLIVSANDGVLADGHRRLACAKILKVTTVPVRVLPGTVRELFELLNGYSKPMDNASWHQAFAMGLPPESVPIKEASYAIEMIRILGWEDYQVMALDKVTSFMYKVALSVGRYVGRTDDNFIRGTLHWLYNQKMQRPVIEAMKNNADTEIILQAINENKPLASMVIWGVA